MIKFFRRTRILYIFSAIACVISGVFTAVELIGFDLSNFLQHPDDYTRLTVLAIAFIFTGVLTLALFCITRDAEEDFKAVFDYASKKEEKSE